MSQTCTRLPDIKAPKILRASQHTSHSCTYPVVNIINGASQYPHPSDADFKFKIRRIWMRICCTIKIISYFSYSNST